MNNKGFTLVELLAVIVILALLALLTTTSITKLVKDSKSDLSDIQIASIKASAEIWGSENLDILPDDGECKYITLKDLKNNGLIDSDVVDPSTTEKISDDLKIKITAESTSKGKIIHIYQVNPKSIDGCKYIPNGDVNGDGVVNDQDVIDLSYYLIQDVSVEFPQNGDMNEDGKISVVDINLLSIKVGLVISVSGDTGILGDSDGNGLIEENDMTVIIQYLHYSIDITDFVKINADVYGDDYIAITDYVLLQKVINKNEDYVKEY
ncbi:MAG: prepilin-type N-terminal cleavage/methylation domain-containing protein [Bacilli bacterium]|nr:prepilin-type N-terminal cleavage/methylation domain-containing protein [Bacilli bacterium]